MSSKYTACHILCGYTSYVGWQDAIVHNQALQCILLQDYVHRVGRTARAGRAGRSVTLVTPHDIGLVHAIEELVNNKMVEMEMDEERVALILTQVGRIFI